MGQVVDDRYEVVRRLARGGMATVYVAHDLRLSRTVALKMMNEGLGESEDFAHRFDAEARAAAHLTHPNVVSVFDQGVGDGRPYIVMEYVEGCTLRQLITREAPMDPRRVLDLMEPVTAALAAAHAAGLIHRDIKPENVLISDRGQVKVADFGLARAITAQSHASTTGLVIGTVSYIAPELVTKGRADARSDIYSLGIVLYEMLTGQKPHTGETPIQVAYSHVHNQIPAPSASLTTRWRDSRSGIPAYVDALVTSAANRERANRPADAGVLLAHLREARAALEHGIADDPALTARMREVTLPASTHETRALAALPHPSPERRFTPVTPVSPSLEVSEDGAPFYSTGPQAYSPQSPHTSTLPVVAEPKKKRRGRRPVGVRIAAWVAVLALIAGVGWGGWYLVEGRWTTTPRLATMSQTDAQATAQASGLAVVFDREYSETVPSGQVTRTDPAEGDRVLRSGTLTAWVSRGPERHPVPQVTGLTLADATSALTRGNLALGAVREDYHDTVALGAVVSQATSPGSQVKRDTRVDLVVSRGPAPVELGDWVGKPLAEASAWAETAGLKVAASEENHDTIPAGSIISQNPAAGTAHRGDTLTLVVSKGPVMVAIPGDLRGKSADDAARILREAGFKPEVKRLVNGGFGLVLRTEPAEGTMVPRGSVVTVLLV